MRRWSVAVAFTLLSGCALVSGLDKIGTGPGSGDASGADGTVDDAANGSDALADARDGSKQDTGPAPGDPGVRCGSNQLVCTSPQHCCQSNNGYGYTCVGQCPDLQIDCDDTFDCGGGGKVCCADLFGGQVTAVSCQDQGSCSIGSSHQQLCDPTAASPCANGRTCTGPAPSGLANIYRTCQ